MEQDRRVRTRESGTSVRPSEHISRSMVYAPTQSSTEKDSVGPSRKKPASSRLGRLSSSMPPERPGRVAEDSFEERLRRKLEKESPSQNSRPEVAGAQSSTASAGESFEERIRRKLEEDKASAIDKPKSDIVHSSAASVTTERLASSSRESSSLGPLSSSVPPRFSVNTSEPAGLSLEERIRRKLEKFDGARQAKDTGALSSHTPLSSSVSPGNSDKGVSSVNLSFEERIRRKLQDETASTKDKSSKAKEPVRNSFPRPKLRTLSQPDIGNVDESGEVGNIHKMHGKKNSKRLQRPLGMSASLIDNLSGEEDLEQRSLTLENKMQSKQKWMKGAKESNSSAFERDAATNFSQCALSDSNDDAKLRMTRRSIRAGLNRRIAREDHDDNEQGALADGKGLILRSCSSSNLIPGSWECTFCTFINESVSGVSIAICKMCRNPHQAPLDQGRLIHQDLLIANQEKSFKLNDLLDDFASSGHQNVESWSQLDNVLELAKHESSVEVGTTNAIVTKQPLGSGKIVDSWSELGDIVDLTKIVSIGDACARGNRRASDAEVWFCDSCAQRNLDCYATFCLICGKRRL